MERDVDSQWTIHGSIAFHSTIELLYSKGQQTASSIVAKPNTVSFTHEAIIRLKSLHWHDRASLQNRCNFLRILGESKASANRELCARKGALKNPACPYTIVQAVPAFKYERGYPIGYFTSRDPRMLTWPTKIVHWI